MLQDVLDKVRVWESAVHFSLLSSCQIDFALGMALLPVGSTDQPNRAPVCVQPQSTSSLKLCWVLSLMAVFLSAAPFGLWHSRKQKVNPHISHTPEVPDAQECPCTTSSNIRHRVSGQHGCKGFSAG